MVRPFNTCPSGVPILTSWESHQNLTPGSYTVPKGAAQELESDASLLSPRQKVQRPGSQVLLYNFAKKTMSVGLIKLLTSSYHMTHSMLGTFTML